MNGAQERQITPCWTWTTCLAFDRDTDSTWWMSLQQFSSKLSTADFRSSKRILQNVHIYLIRVDSIKEQLSLPWHWSVSRGYLVRRSNTAKSTRERERESFEGILLLMTTVSSNKYFDGWHSAKIWFLGL